MPIFVELYIVKTTLIIFLIYLKITLWMITYRTHFRSGRSYNDVSAVSTFPNFDLTLFKDLSRLDIFKQSAVSLFVVLFDFANCAESKNTTKNVTVPYCAT